MKLTKLQDKWAAGGNGLNGWCSIPSSVTAEIMAGYDFDSLTIDLQHGLVDYQTALTMLQAMTASGITPMARVPWNEPGIIMKPVSYTHIRAHDTQTNLVITKKK